MKRLIVLCDGTWQDELSAEIGKDPTNITRFSRALSPHALIDGNTVPQIVYYIPGVGTKSGDLLRGGAIGLGLSANVRAGYGFLAHNYSPGDEIFFFGFSRGAYTARSIAGIVTYLGLLTKRGMDRFPEVYEEYYKHAHDRNKPEFSERILSRVEGQIHDQSQGAVKIVGVWDTVATHSGGQHGERVEFYNQTLSDKVKCGYHALALDERRNLYKPVLWEGQTPVGQEVIQAWFSGTHSDIGGGRGDPRLSNISLAWMIAQCARGGKLSFTDVADPSSSYLIDRSKTQAAAESQDWATRGGPTDNGDSGIWWLMNKAQALFMSADREPGEVADANQQVHRSIISRDMAKWPCNVLHGAPSTGGPWQLKSRGKIDALTETAEGAVENSFKNRIRPWDS